MKRTLESILLIITELSMFTKYNLLDWLNWQNLLYASIKKDQAQYSSKNKKWFVEDSEKNFDYQNLDLVELIEVLCTILT